MDDTGWRIRKREKLDGLRSLIRLDSGVRVLQMLGWIGGNPGVDLLQDGGMPGCVARVWDLIALWAVILSLWM